MLLGFSKQWTSWIHLPSLVLRLLEISFSLLQSVGESELLTLQSPTLVVSTSLDLHSLLIGGDLQSSLLLPLPLLLLAWVCRESGRMN